MIVVVEVVVVVVVVVVASCWQRRIPVGAICKEVRPCGIRLNTNCKHRTIRFLSGTVTLPMSNVIPATSTRYTLYLIQIIERNVASNPPRHVPRRNEHGYTICPHITGLFCVLAAVHISPAVIPCLSTDHSITVWVMCWSRAISHGARYSTWLPGARK